MKKLAILVASGILALSIVLLVPEVAVAFIRDSGPPWPGVAGQNGDLPNGWQTIMSENFEGIFPPDRWAVSTESGTADASWGQDGYRPHGGNYSAFCAKQGTRAANPADGEYYPDNMQTWLVYGPFSLAGRSYATLDYYVSLQADYPHDTLYVMASIDNSYYYGKGWSGSIGWTKSTFDLTDVPGLGDVTGEPEVWIAFIFTSNSDNITMEGAWVDDVLLRAGSIPSPTTTPTATTPPTITPPTTPPTTTTSGGGGGYGGGGGAPTGPGETNLTVYTNSEGIFNLEGTALSADGRVKMLFSKGLLAQAKDGTALKSVKIMPLDDPEDATKGSTLVSLAYEITPAGATFDPGTLLTIYYDPDTVPENLDIGTLTLVWYDLADKAWEALESSHDKSDHGITATVDHLSIYALLGEYSITPTRTVRLQAAKFSITDAMVSPAVVPPGDSITITASVNNTGGSSGIYEVVLKVNGIVEDTSKVTVPGGNSATVTFKVSRSEPGLYQIDINGITSSFTVGEVLLPTTTVPPQTGKPSRSSEGRIIWIILGVATGILIIIGLGILTLSKKEHRA